jgi:hypothetical protein
LKKAAGKVPGVAKLEAKGKAAKTVGKGLSSKKITLINTLPA